MKHFAEAMSRFATDLQNEKIGCKFGWEAAQQDKVFYVGYRPEELWHDFVQFINQTRYKVLTIIPDEEMGSKVPISFDEGKNMAFKMYQELHVTCRGMSIDAYEKLYHKPWFDREAACKAIPIMGVDSVVYQQLFSLKKVREVVCKKLPLEGSPLALQILNEKTADLERIIPFAMAPYYTPVRDGKQHTRYARDYGVFLTLQSDIHEVMSTRQAEVAKTQEWKRDATGSKYLSQGLHIPVEITG